MLIKKAVSVRKHLERNRKDKDSKFRLILIESRIHRLARYYRTARKLPANWKYESATASTLVGGVTVRRIFGRGEVNIEFVTSIRVNREVLEMNRASGMINHAICVIE
jgi:hypothetical protein